MKVTLTAGTARLITGLLEMLAELPSTPAMVARGAYQHLARIEELLPTPHGRQAWDEGQQWTSSVEIDVESAVGVAELLELFCELPSTPPAVSADAMHQAATVREKIEEASASRPSEPSSR